MGATKSYEFSAKENRLAKYGKALAHPARVAILKLLATKSTCQCGDIVEELPLSQSTVSQHLKELKEAGLIKGEIDGAKVCYCIDEKSGRQHRCGLISYSIAIKVAMVVANLFFANNHRNISITSKYKYNGNTRTSKRFGKAEIQ